MDTRSAAHRYAELGYHVLPVLPGCKRPASEHGLLDATTDSDQIDAWWDRWPDANVGIRTDGLVVVDIDGAQNPWLSDRPELQLDLAGAPSATTPRGGRHIVLRAPAGSRVRNSAGRLAPNVDIRADGGYIVAAPSRTEHGHYTWVGEGLDVPVGQLPEAPEWLMRALVHPAESRASAPARIAVASEASDGNVIRQGTRNSTLTSLAGSMRRRGMTRDEISAALRAVNTGRCRPPLDVDEVDRIAASIASKPPHASIALGQSYHPGDAASSGAAGLRSVGELRKQFPALRPPVIDGLLRRGETMNVIASPKVGKSWLVLDLAIAVATGQLWLGTYETHAGEVLLIDNELHPETSSHRIPLVAGARGVPVSQVDDRVFVHNLRGQLRDIISYSSFFETLTPGRFSLIVLDAFYRFMPEGSDENDNGRMASIYNHIDRYAERLGCGFVLVHHTSKGGQGSKSVTDVGAGAGSQSRATDTHLVLRPHEEPGAVVLEAATRSWPQPEARCLRWTFPVWNPDRDLDPVKLKGEKPRKRKEEQCELSGRQFAERFGSAEPKERSELVSLAGKVGVSQRRAEALLREAEREGHIFRLESGRNRAVRYTTSRPGTAAEVHA